MKIASYIKSGKPEFGVVVGDGFATLSGLLAARYPTLKAVLQQGALAELRALAEDRDADVSFDEVTFLPPITNPEKVMLVGTNYRAHAVELGRKFPVEPVIGPRWNNTFVGHGAAIVRPKVSQCFDFEGELAVIIGRQGRHIPVESSMDYVAGYSIFNDGSIRDYQERQPIIGKNFINAASFGPWMVTCDEIEDPADLTLQTRLNGVVVQDGRTDDMIFSIGEVIAFASTFTRLEPGDVITTGTPQGIGWLRTPKLWMKPGDVCEVELGGIGVLRNFVIDEL